MEENDKVLILRLLIKATFVLLFISVVLKLLGLNVFGVDTSNAILLNISNFIDKYYLKNIIDLSLLFVHYFIFFKLVCKNNNYKTYILFSFIAIFLTSILQIVIYSNIYESNEDLFDFIYYFATFCILLTFPFLIDKNKGKKLNFYYYFKKTVKIVLFILLISFYQFIVMYIRSITYSQTLENLYDLILNFDYTILLMATYYLYLKKDNHTELNSYFEFSLTKLLDERLSFDDVKVLVLKYNDFKKKFKESNKTDKVIIVLYLFFAILSEIINLSLVIFVAYLNNALIECFFIITSFLISRKVFGAFHLDSAIKCWFMSNISFYILDKLALKVNATFVIPVLCGIALSYITSKFIKKNNKDLYRGMAEKDLIDLSNNKRLTTLEYEILKKYYCEGINMNKLTFIYHYSRAQLYRYKSNAEKKIAS